jgi:hypothetical protein
MGASGSPYALQYQPTHARTGAWQLYHGPGYTAPAVFDRTRWTRVRVEVGGSRARVFVGDSATEPALVVAALKRGVGPGAFGVVEGTASVDAPGVYFSNFRYTVRRSAVAEPAAAELAAAMPGAPSGTAGAICRWELSPAVAVDRAPLDTLPAAARGDRRGWVAAEAEPNGLVNIARYRAMAGPRSLVLARAVIHADRDEVRRLAFGYSDDVTVFLNGQPVFAGRNGYDARYPSASGLVTADDAVFLPLRRGTNELVLAVAEEFGGWGFLARLARAGAPASAPASAPAAVPASVGASPGSPAQGCVATHPPASTTAPVPERNAPGALVRAFARHAIVAEGKVSPSRAAGRRSCAE